VQALEIVVMDSFEHPLEAIVRRIAVESRETLERRIQPPGAVLERP
jgi:hypothetical protein